MAVTGGQVPDLADPNGEFVPLSNWLDQRFTSLQPSRLSPHRSQLTSEPLRDQSSFRFQNRAEKPVEKPVRLILIVAALFLVLTGCVTVRIPIEEYNLARAAMDSARESEAPRYAASAWYKAEEAYKDAQRLYKERLYPQAERRFVEAKFFAERAENVARVARFQSGDDAP